MTQIPFLSGLSDVQDRYDYFILDIFGVLHDGIKPFSGTIDALTQLKANGKKICLLSNTPRPAIGAVRHMESMGIGRELYDEIVTSGEATIHHLQNRPDDFHQNCGNSCWFIGTPMAAEILDGLDLSYVNGPEDASFILNSIPGQIGRDSAFQKQLDDAASRDIPMICANPDMVVNIGDEQYECAGTFAKIYEDLGGRVVYHGKPYAPVYDMCYDLLGRPDKSKIIAIGDSIHTDITGAERFGIDSIFNLVGIHWEEVQLDHAPGKHDLAKIQRLVETDPHKPTYTMASLNL